MNLKIGLLALGNIMGLFWNYIFKAFVEAGTLTFGEIFTNLYTISYPFISSLWIISFWSLSLTALHYPKETMVEK
jgi:hypothetical protein